MTSTIGTDRDHASPTDQPGGTPPEPVLPELRTMWWETGLQARAEAGLFAVFTELPSLVAQSVKLSWRADRLRTGVVAVATLGAGVMAAFGLLATQRVLVELFAGGPTPDKVVAALPALVALAAATAIRAAMGIATGYALNGLTPRLDRQVQRGLFEVTTAVRLDAFDADAFADDMERGSRGSDSAISLVQASMNLLAGLVGLVAVMFAVIVIHPLLLVALLVATLPGAWAALRAGHLRYRTYAAGSVRRRRLWLLHRLMAERDSAPELRSYGLRRFLLDQYDRVMDVETDIQLALARRVTTTTSVGALIGGVATGVVYVLLGVLLIDGQIPLAAAATCVIAVQSAQRSLATVTFQVDRIYTEGRHFGDYTGFMTRATAYLPDESAGPDRSGAPTPSDADRSGAPVRSDVPVRSDAASAGRSDAASTGRSGGASGGRSDHSGAGAAHTNGPDDPTDDAAERTQRGVLRELAVRGVSLRYPDRENPAVHDVTLTIRAGQTVAFVGENGSGKSTLAAMIATLRSPDTGVIEWNGRPFSDLGPEQLRARIAVVTQEYHKWPFTAATNIAIGDADAVVEQGRIEAAAVLAAAHDVIRELPYGYETLLDRTFAKGQDLSGGQWQRITAARGFLRDADLLIMDEPSSALDPRAEDALFQAIRDRHGRATTILITHRLANIRHADRIFVLHQGRLAEAGNHDELMRAGGRYAELFSLQAAGYHATPIG